MKSLLVYVVVVVLAWVLPIWVLPAHVALASSGTIPALGMVGVHYYRPPSKPRLKVPPAKTQIPPQRGPRGTIPGGDGKPGPGELTPPKEETTQPGSRGPKRNSKDPLDGISGFFPLAPKPHVGPLHAQEVFFDTVIPYLESIGLSEGDIRKGFSIIPSHDGIPISKTNVEELLRLRCGTSNTPVCRSLIKSRGARQESELLERETSFRAGQSFQEYKKALSREEREYFFPQTQPFLSCPKVPSQGLARVPIEHSGVRVTAWEDETGSSPTGRVFLKYQTTNCVAMSPKDVVTIATLALKKHALVCCSPAIEPSTAKLVLLPYPASDKKLGKDEAGLRFAYRVPVAIKIQERTRSRMVWHYLWLDAQDKTGLVLQLVSLARYATAKGNMIVRNPSTREAPLVDFPIDDKDDKVGTQATYTLQLQPQFERLDRYASPGASDPEVAADTSDFHTWLGAQSSPANDPPNYQCIYDQTSPLYPGIYYEQIDLMATLARQWKEVDSTGGLLSGFPGGHPIKVIFNRSSSGCSGLAETESAGPYQGPTITFGLCKRPSASYTCLGQSIQGTNPIHDHTLVAHEFGHILTEFQYRHRSEDWCHFSGPQGANVPFLTACPLPQLPSTSFHDFADAWAHHFEDTPCVGGWVSKGELNEIDNELGLSTSSVDPSLNCARHSENSGMPRLSQASLPDVKDPRSQDHFPEHLKKWDGPYARMQIAAAALWATREGLRSHLGSLFGPAAYFRAFVRSLLSTGWLGIDYERTFTEEHAYAGLFDLEVSLANEWVKSSVSVSRTAASETAVSETAFLLGKIAAGFAKVGVFMVPPACLDSTKPSILPTSCSSGIDGGDAVIDIDDNDTSDDEKIDHEKIDGVTHQEVDYLKRGGSAPTFLIWTGPTYTFSRGNATSVSPPCNKEYKVEAATDAKFTVNLVTKDWEVLPANGVPCFVRWTPDSAQWNTLRGSSGETRVFYRVKTRKSSAATVLSSTSPAKGLFDVYFPGKSVPPLYAVINDTGTPVYPELPSPPATDHVPLSPPQRLRIN